MKYQSLYIEESSITVECKFAPLPSLTTAAAATKKKEYESLKNESNQHQN